MNRSDINALHKIPLCDFKYAGEVHSGAAFKYNTAVQILKYRPRVLSKEIKEIQRNKTNISNKVLYKSTVSIFKNSKKYLYKKLYEINTKKFAMELRLSNRDINKESIFSLKAQNIDFIKGSGIELEKNNVLMDMESSVYFESGYLNFIKNSSLELKTPNISMNVITDKSLQSPESKIIDVGESINLFRRWQMGSIKRACLLFLIDKNYH
ncbi:hypothetical protein [Clostridium ljungdahlii]|uniref:hypothetical protein n=1 Tax=Clostridium ljungdahlii TaxID=1538 RepID=UPI00386512C0